MTNIEQYYKYYADLSDIKDKNQKVYFLTKDKETVPVFLTDESLSEYELDKEKSTELSEFCYLKGKNK